MEEASKGRVFKNMVSLNLSSITAVAFTKTFPQLQILSLDVCDARPLLGIEHKTLNVLRIHALKPNIWEVLEINWHINCPRLILIENKFNSQENMVAMCKSSGLALVKPGEITEYI